MDLHLLMVVRCPLSTRERWMLRVQCSTSRFKDGRDARKASSFMDVQVVKDFVRRVTHDEGLRQEVERDPQGVSQREGFSPTVSAVVLRLVPHLSLTEKTSGVAFNWWNY